MPITAEVGSVYRVIDEATAVLTKISEGWAKITAQTDLAMESISKLKLAVGQLNTEFATTFREIGDDVRVLAGTIDKDLSAAFDTVKLDARSFGATATTEFRAVGDAASQTRAQVASIATSYREAETAARGMAVASRTASMGGAEHRGGFGRSTGGGHRGGFHMSRFGGEALGQHVGMTPHGDGTGELVGGFVALELAKKAVEADMELKKWAVQLSTTQKSSSDVPNAVAAAWNLANKNQNTTAVGNLKDIVELNKVTADVDRSIQLLPAFEQAAAAIRSVKSEDLKTNLQSGTQNLNLARSTEEMGVTNNPNLSAEQNDANTRRYVAAIMQTIVSSRGLIDGNSMYALTNNSGGQAENWSERTATVYMPIIGEIMKASKAGNANYMAIRAFAQGNMTPKAVYALKDRHLIEDSDIHYNESTGKVDGLVANNSLGKGLVEDPIAWRNRILGELRAQGVDTSNQEVMRDVINELQLNKTVGNYVRTLAEPNTAAQIDKEIGLRDRTDPSKLSEDPALKLEALSNKWKDLMTVLGGPITDLALAGVTKLTNGLRTMSEFFQAHPDIASFTIHATAFGGALLAASGSIKLVISLLSGPGSLGTAATSAGGALSSLLGPLTAMIGLATYADQKGIFAAPKRSGLGGVLEFLDPGLADRWAPRDTTSTPVAPRDDSSDAYWKRKNAFLHHTAFEMGGGGESEDAIYRGTLRAFTDFANGVPPGSGGFGGGGGGIINASYGGDAGFGIGGRSGGGGYAGGGLSALGGGRVTGSILSRGDAAMAHLVSMGVSREAAAAIVGNAQQESSITGHGPAGDHGSAHGMFQWRFDRFSALQQFASARGKDWRDENTELDFMVDEAKKRGNAGWLYGHDVYAANQGMQRFEQYGESADHGNFRTRLGNAHMWLGRPAAHADSPGVPPRAPTMIQANINTHIDGERVASHVSRHIVADNSFSHGHSSHDDHADYAPPDLAFG